MLQNKAYYVKPKLSLDPSWLKTKMYEEKILVPPGTQIFVGKVASVQLKTGTVLSGGAEQILLPSNWPRAWVVGYRRITSRQLQIPPQYRDTPPPEYDEKPRGKGIIPNSLYRLVCPRCCSEDVRKLPKQEQFVITGVKGGQYRMKYVCNENDCMYYW